MKKIKAQKDNLKRGEVVIYKTATNAVELKVQFQDETVWLDARQMALLFGAQRPAIVKHVNNIYKAKELDASLTCSILEQVAADGKLRKINLYNLDMIISVGYRVNSIRATQFRIWATRTLKKYLLHGYALNETRLAEARAKFNELQTAVAFLQAKSQKELLKGQAGEILNLLANYAKTLSTLQAYDRGALAKVKGKKTAFVLAYKDCLTIIERIKAELTAKKEAGDLFGQERGQSFASIIRGLYQTFEGKELYPTIEDKASHLLYFTIKDHPFSDGNKRTAAFLFVYFLDKTNYLYRSSGEKKINDNALTALALLIAESDPKEKETMVMIIKHLITE